jgi:hypothetical protein
MLPARHSRTIRTPGRQRRRIGAASVFARTGQAASRRRLPRSIACPPREAGGHWGRLAPVGAPNSSAAPARRGTTRARPCGAQARRLHHSRTWWKNSPKGPRPSMQGTPRATSRLASEPPPAAWPRRPAGRRGGVGLVGGRRRCDAAMGSIGGRVTPPLTSTRTPRSRSGTSTTPAKGSRARACSAARHPLGVGDRSRSGRRPGTRRLLGHGVLRGAALDQADVEGHAAGVVGHRLDARTISASAWIALTPAGGRRRRGPPCRATVIVYTPPPLRAVTMRSCLRGPTRTPGRRWCAARAGS